MKCFVEETGCEDLTDIWEYFEPDIIVMDICTVQVRVADDILIQVEIEPENVALNRPMTFRERLPAA